MLIDDGENMIVVKNLYKDFGKKNVINNMNFCINRGQLVALLGENGAGKTTLMRLMCGLITPTIGNVSVMGCDMQQNREEALKYMAYLPENNPLYDDMTVFEYVEFMAKTKNVPSEEIIMGFNELAEDFSLKNVVNQKLGTLSKGFRTRAALAACMIARPKVLLLDEPTDGLDPNQKYQVRWFIQEYAKKNIVIISTHIMEEVEALDPRVLFIKGGKLVADTSVTEIKKLALDMRVETAFRTMTAI